MDIKVIAIVGLGAFLVLWYGAGYLYNHRHGQRLFRWLEAGLDVLGGERESGWIGSPASGARVNIVRAHPPFRRLEITLLLENREVPLLWLFDHLRNKRDRLIMRMTLRSPRRGEIEIGSVRRKAARRREQPWTWQEEPHGLAAAYLGPGVQRQVKALEPWLEAYGAHLHRFSWRKQDPHIQMQVNVGGLLSTSSETFFADLQSAVKGTAHVKK